MRYFTSTTAAASIVLAGAAYFSPWLWRQYRMARIRRKVTKNRILALTYDDGPSRSLTPQLLDLLQSRGAKATFFMLGRNVQQYPEIVNRVMRDGHDIGCHSDKHINAWMASPGEAVADIDAGYERLSPWISPYGMFRPPYGKMTLPTYASIWRRGASVWWWTIDSGDTHNALPCRTDVLKRVQKDGGGIVLMHDLERTQSRQDFVLQTTEALLDLAKRESFHIAPLSEICL